MIDTTVAPDRRSRRITLRIILSLGVIVVVIFGWVFFNDVPPPNDADLLVAPRPVTVAPNGYKALVAAGNAIITHPDNPTGRRLINLINEHANPRPGRGWDDPETRALARRVVEELTPVMSQIEQGLELPCVAPSLEGQPLGANHAGTQALRTVGLFLHLRAGVALHEDRPREALGSVLAQIRLGAALRRDAESIDLALTGELGESRGWQDLRILMAPPSFDAPSCEQALQLSLSLFEQLEAPIDNVLRSEYTWLRSMILGLPQELEFKPNRTLARLADFLRNAIATARVPAVNTPPIATRRSEAIVDLFTGNRKGSGWLAMITPSCNMYLRSRPFSQFERRATLIALAIRAHEFRHGKPPASLEALVPEFLPAIPLDPFDGEPLRYDREERWIWSVGRDGIDSGGNPQPLYFDENAPTITIPEKH